MMIDVRRWTPELAWRPNACIHQRRRSGDRFLGALCARPGGNFPAPIVDHAKARHAALAASEMPQ
jgi:deoxyribodipyrimidine photolyase